MIPELILHSYLEKMTLLLQKDIHNTKEKEKTILYSILEGDSYRGSEYYKTAVELFSRRKEHPNSIKINYSFIMDRASMPSLSLSTPTESTDQQLNSMAVGEEGYYDIVKEGPDGRDMVYPILSRSYKASVNIVISSLNFMEQTIIYHVYRGLLMSILPQLQLDGFINPSLSGREVQVNPELVQTNIYVRMLTINFSYTTEVTGIVGKQIINAICAEKNVKVLDPHR